MMAAASVEVTVVCGHVRRQICAAPDDTFSVLRETIAAELGVSPAALGKMIAAGKDRSNSADTVGLVAGKKSKLKLKVFLLRGYSIPQDAPSLSEQQTRELTAEPQPPPQPQASCSSAAIAQGALRVVVRQGSARHEIVAPSLDFTVGDVKTSLEKRGLAPVSQQRLIHGGRIVRDDSASLRDCGCVGNSTVKMVLIFTARKHDEDEGSAYLRGIETELDEIERKFAELKSLRKHRLSDCGSARVRTEQLLDSLGNIEVGFDAISVAAADRERKRAALQKLRALQESLRSFSDHVF